MLCIVILALYMASAKGDNYAILELLKEGYSVNSIYNSGKSMIHYFWIIIYKEKNTLIDI